MVQSAQRICSLLPSATEIVYALGLGDRLVAVTHECDYPLDASGHPAVTSTGFNPASMSNKDIHNHVTENVHSGSSIYTLDQPLLEQLNPDLILTQELCDVCAVSYDTVKDAVRHLRGDNTILSLEPTSLAAILDTIMQVGSATGTESQAEQVVADLKARIAAVKERAGRRQSGPASSRWSGWTRHSRVDIGCRRWCASRVGQPASYPRGSRRERSRGTRS